MAWATAGNVSISTDDGDSWTQVFDPPEGNLKGYSSMCRDAEDRLWVCWMSDLGSRTNNRLAVFVSRSDNQGRNWSTPAMPSLRSDWHQSFPSISRMAGKMVMCWFETQKYPGDGHPDYNPNPGPAVYRGEQVKLAFLNDGESITNDWRVITPSSGLDNVHPSINYSNHAMDRTQILLTYGQWRSGKDNSFGIVHCGKPE